MAAQEKIADKLFEQYYAELYSWAQRCAIGYPKSFQEDAIGEAMLRMVSVSRRWNPAGGASYRRFLKMKIAWAILDYSRAGVEGYSRQRGRYATFVSLYAPVDDDTAESKELLFEDILPEHRTTYPQRMVELREALESLPDHLSYREAFCLCTDATQSEIAEMLEISDSRVSQIRTEARRKLACAGVLELVA